MVPTVGGLGLSSLDGVQKEVLCLPEQGHTVVLGTAGSGKSILAVHRALYLADPDTEHCGRTLLITFNRCLATYLRHLAGRIPGNITVENYHKFARGYLGSRQRMGRGVIAGPSLAAALCAEAVETTKTESPTSSLWRRSNRFFLDGARDKAHIALEKSHLRAFCDLKIGHLGEHAVGVSPNLRQSSHSEARQLA